MHSLITLRILAEDTKKIRFVKTTCILMETQMRLTKRQLKRIIREEYSRLKRRGLIKEMGGFSQEVDDYCEQIMEELAMGDEMSYEELAGALGAIMPGFDEAMLGSAIDQCIQRGMIEARTGRDGLGVFMISNQYRM